MPGAAARRASALVVVAGWLASASCSHLAGRPVETRVDELDRWTESREREELGAPRLRVSTSDDGTRVTATVERPLRCVSEQVTRREVRDVERFRPRWGVAAPALAGGAVGWGVGGYLTFSAGGRPDIDDPFSRGELSKQASLGIGVPLMALGTAALATGIAALAAARPRVGEVRTVETVDAQDERDCGVVAEQDADVTLTRWDGEAWTATTDEAGEARFRVEREDLQAPPAGQAWATVFADSCEPRAVEPPAGVLVAVEAEVEEGSPARVDFPTARVVMTSNLRDAERGFLEARLGGLEAMVDTTLAEETGDVGEQVELEVTYDGGVILMTLLERRPTPRWEGLGIATDRHAGTFLDSYRAFLLISCMSRWIFTVMRDAVSEHGWEFGEALSNARLAAMFVREDTDELLAIPGVRIDFTTRGAWAAISAPVMVVSPAPAAVEVWPRGEVLDTHRYYYLPAREGLDGQPTPADAVYRFFE